MTRRSPLPRLAAALAAGCLLAVPAMSFDKPANAAEAAPAGDLPPMRAAAGGAFAQNDARADGSRRAKRPNVALVGDSLAVGTGPVLAAELPGRGVRTYARVGRSTREGVGAIRSLRDAGRLPGVVAVSLGTNDSPSPRAFRARVREVLELAGPGRCVVWASVSRPAISGQSWTALNDVLADAARGNPRVRLVKWAATVRAGRARLSDGVHPGPDGYRTLGRLYANAVRSCP